MTDKNTMAPKKKKGRPTKYTEALGKDICRKLADGQYLTDILKDIGIGRQTFYDWLSANESFSVQYARALDIRDEVWYDDMMKTANTPFYDTIEESGTAPSGDTWDKTKKEDNVAHRRLKIDTLRWALSKRHPERFGDRMTTEIVGKNGGAIETKVDHGVGGLSSEQLAAIALLKTSNED